MKQPDDSLQIFQLFLVGESYFLEFWVFFFFFCCCCGDCILEFVTVFPTDYEYRVERFKIKMALPHMLGPILIVGGLFLVQAILLANDFP